jgi:hypothetical protein
MTTLANNITSTAQTTFSSIPNGITQLTSDTSLRLATTAYVQANVAGVTPSNYLLTNTNQTLTGTPSLSFANQQIITDVDSIAIGDTLVVGETADSNITLGQSTSACVLYIKTFLQPITSIWKFWANSSINTTVPTGVAVLGKKVQTGSYTVSSTAQGISFLTNYTSKPVVILSLRSTSGVAGLNQNKWVSSVGSFGFVANTTATGINLEMNWFAIGD